MENNLIGIVKFFRDETYLDRLVDEGCIYCKTPENYRLESLEGVGDKSESCKFSYRAQRNDSLVSIEIDGQEIEISDMTIHAQGGSDSWLHCWFYLTLPSNLVEWKELISNIRRVKLEFGSHYAFIPAHKINNFYDAIIKNSPKPTMCGQVSYSSDASTWSPFSKALNYPYQREFRFIFGVCSISETNPYIFYCMSGLEGIIEKTPSLKLMCKDNPYRFVDLQYI